MNLGFQGRIGVAHILELYRSEIDRVMGLLGVKSIAEITPDSLFRPDARIGAAGLAAGSERGGRRA